MLNYLPGKHGLVAEPNDDFNCENPANRENKTKNGEFIGFGFRFGDQRVS